MPEKVLKEEIKFRADLVKLLSQLKIISDKNNNRDLEGEILLHGVDAKDKRGWTAMHYAAEAGNIKAVKALHAAGARCLTEDNEQLTPLHLAAMYNHDKALKELLMRRRFSDHLKTKDCYGRTPLKVALEEKAKKTIKLLHEFTHPNEIIKIARVPPKLFRSRGKKVREVEKLSGYGLRTEGAIIHTDLHAGPTARLAQGHIINNLIDFLNRKANQDRTGKLYYKSYEKHQKLQPKIDKLKKKIAEYQAKGIAGNRLESLQKELAEKEAVLKALGLSSADVFNKSGVCNGLSFLWHLLPHDEFQGYLELVMTWNDYIPGGRLRDKIDSISFLPETIKAKFKGKTREDVFLYLIQTISVFQQTSPTIAALELNIQQEEREKQFSLVNTTHSNIKLKKIFEKINLTLNEDQFAEMISIYSAWPGLRIDLVSSKEEEGHAVGLYINPKGWLEYYDPNESNIVKRFDNPKAFADYYFKMNKLIDFINPKNTLTVRFNSTFKFYHRNQPMPEFEKATRIPQYHRKSPNQFNTLHYAVLENNLQKIEEHLKSPANLIDMITKDAHGNTPLMLARKLGYSYTEILRILKAAWEGHKINLANRRKRFIALAKDENNLKELSALLENPSELVLLKEVTDLAIQHELENIEVETPLEVAINSNCPPKVINFILSRTSNFEITKYLKLGIKERVSKDVLASLLKKAEETGPVNLDRIHVILDQTPFMYAIVKENTEAIEFFMERGCSLAARDELGRTPLMLALKYLPLKDNEANRKIILKMIKGVHINLPDNTGKTPLMYAIEHHAPIEIQRVLLAVTKINKDTSTKSGKKIIDYIIESGNLEMLTALITKAPAVRDDYYKALERFLIKGKMDTPEKRGIIIELINGIPDLLAKSEKEHLFQKAIQAGASKEVLGILLKEGVPITPPAIIAIINASPKLGNDYVKHLLLHQPEPPPHWQWQPNLIINPATEDTALTCALKAKPPNTEIILWLLKAGEVLPIAMRKYHSLFMSIVELASFNAGPALLDYLIEQEENLATKKDKQGKTALMYALKCHAGLETIQKMIKMGCEINTKDNQGMTVLMHALQQQASEPVLEDLIKHGANLSPKDNQGNNALFYALQYHASSNIVKQLIQHCTHAELNQAFKFALTQNTHGENNNNLKVLLEQMSVLKSPLDSDLLIQAIKAHAASDILVQLIPRSNLQVNEAPNQRTPLMCALREGASITVIRHLIRARTINQMDLQGMTPLMHALDTYQDPNKAEKLEIIRLLLLNHANVNAKTFTGKTVFGYAQEDPELLALLKNPPQKPPLPPKAREPAEPLAAPSPTMVRRTKKPTITHELLTHELIVPKGGHIKELIQHVESQPGGTLRVAEEPHHIKNIEDPGFHPQKATAIQIMNNPYQIFAHETQDKDKMVYSISKKQEGRDEQYDDALKEACRLAIATAEPYSKIDLSRTSPALKAKIERILTEQIAATKYNPPESAPVIIGKKGPRTELQG